MQPDPLLERWVTQLRKGMLELCVLHAIRGGGGRVYGYDVVKRLRGLDGLVISDGTIYPILSRLKRDGLVSSTIEESPEGPPRKYYRLTAKGDRLLREMNGYWQTIQTGIESLKSEDEP